MRYGKLVAAAAAIGCGVWIGSMLTALANSIPPAGQPGSAEDPVVTKSYVDEQIQRALSGKTVGEPNDSDDAGAIVYEVVLLQAGHMLLGGMGTEFIVRTGRAYVHSTSENGIPDLTDGVDLKNNELIPNNHLLMVPREGRGVKVQPDYPNDVYITVKGAFLEVDAEGNAVKAE